MSNKSEATAKDAEGKLESAYGELTGDVGHQIKGKAKQVHASAMNVAEEIKKESIRPARRLPMPLSSNRVSSLKPGGVAASS